MFSSGQTSGQEFTSGLMKFYLLDLFVYHKRKLSKLLNISSTKAGSCFHLLLQKRKILIPMFVPIVESVFRGFYDLFIRSRANAEAQQPSEGSAH